jgi:hypothetical protein
VRVIRVRLKQAGFRTRTVVLVTTRLGPVAYPAEEVAAAYLRRWRTELGLDALKIVASLEAPRGKSPAMIRRGRFALLVAPNPVCAVRASAAHEQAVALDRLSFTGSLDARLSFAALSAQATRRPSAAASGPACPRASPADLVPLRPGRHEPRAVKRRPKSGPRLNRPCCEGRALRHGVRFRRPAKIT